MDWTSEAIERLKTLWAGGHSGAEIGRRMGISKNAVVGKAHRLDLLARPSPIRRDFVPRPPKVPRTPKAARLPTPSEMTRAAPARPREMFGPPEPADLQAERLALETELREERRVVGGTPTRGLPALRLRLRDCQWPIGEPGTSGFRFCGGNPDAQKPYCTEHAAIAYVKPRDRREDAA